MNIAPRHRRSQGDDSYFYLYRISYMWYSPLGFLIVVVVGWAASWILRWIFKEDPADVDPLLLSPIVASGVQKKWMKTDECASTITLHEAYHRKDTY